MQPAIVNIQQEGANKSLFDKDWPAVGITNCLKWAEMGLEPLPADAALQHLNIC